MKKKKLKNQIIDVLILRFSMMVMENTLYVNIVVEAVLLILQCLNFQKRMQLRNLEKNIILGHFT